MASEKKSRKFPAAIRPALTVRLSELALPAGAAVVRDGGFENLGILLQRTQRMLTVLHDPAYLDACNGHATASCVVTTRDLAPKIDARLGLIVADDPQAVFYGIHAALLAGGAFYGLPPSRTIGERSRIHPSAVLATEGVMIGADCLIEENVSIAANTTIGNEVVIRAGTRIGGEGFEFKRIGGSLVRVPHAGGVLIGDRVEILHNSAVARGVFRDLTRIGHETKIDNLVHVAHNAVIGAGCRLAAAAVICGSATIGNEVWIGPNATVSHGVVVGDGAYVCLGAVVVTDVPAGRKVSGNFAVEHGKNLRQWARLRVGKE